MSLSVNELIKGLSSLQNKPGVQEGKMNNPDIPERGVSALGRKAIRDQFYNSMKLTSMPRNGDGYSMDRSGGIPNLNPKRQEFLLEGSIDPAAIRARQNPLKAYPSLYGGNGQYLYKYQIPPSSRVPHNSVSLMQKARQSYSSRLGRLQPISVPVDVKSSVPIKTL